jgi:hypothetical protein
MYNDCMPIHKETITRVEVKIPEGIKSAMLKGLTPWHGIQKYAILAALRMFADLSLEERRRRIDKEVVIEKREEE